MHGNRPQLATNYGLHLVRSEDSVPPCTYCHVQTPTIFCAVFFCIETPSSTLAVSVTATHSSTHLLPDENVGRHSIPPDFGEHADSIRQRPISLEGLNKDGWRTYSREPFLHRTQKDVRVSNLTWALSVSRAESRLSSYLHLVHDLLPSTLSHALTCKLPGTSSVSQRRSR